MLIEDVVDVIPSELYSGVVQFKVIPKGVKDSATYAVVHPLCFYDKEQALYNLDAKDRWCYILYDNEKEVSRGMDLLVDCMTIIRDYLQVQV